MLTTYKRFQIDSFCFGLGWAGLDLTGLDYGLKGDSYLTDHLPANGLPAYAAPITAKHRVGAVKVEK